MNEYRWLGSKVLDSSRGKTVRAGLERLTNAAYTLPSAFQAYISNQRRAMQAKCNIQALQIVSDHAPCRTSA